MVKFFSALFVYKNGFIHWMMARLILSLAICAHFISYSPSRECYVKRAFTFAYYYATYSYYSSFYY